ncbi:MAG: cyclophilin-like fold protein, partial [Herbiconiux sp.]|nr:cyclophilin-like fold protein [Herbiconiux sp.]
MTYRIAALAALALVLSMIAACAPTPEASSDSAEPSTAETSPTASPTPPLSTTAPEHTEPQQVVGTVVRFASDRTSIDVTIGEDSPAVRDFLSLLPLELTVEEFSGAEKIAYL